MFIRLVSTNQDLSWVISKNPATKIVTKKIRTGIGFGFYGNTVSTTAYNLFYLDSKDKSAYAKDNQNYLDTTKYYSPYAALNLLHSFLATALKQKNNLDKKAFNSITLNCKVPKPQYLDIFNKYFKERFLIESELICDRFYKIEISGLTTIHELLNFTSVFLLFCTFFDRDTFFRAEHDLVVKYLNCLNVIKVPYFISYLFKTYLIKSPERLEKVQNLLVNATVEEAKFVWGSTLEQRKNWVRERLNEISEVTTLVDLGCGFEGNYLKLSEKLDNYLPVDLDPEVREEINGKALKYYNNSILPAVENWQEAEEVLKEKNLKNVTVLLTEVLEHMPLEEAALLLKTVASSSYVSYILITVPNKQFNKFYQLDPEEFRHDDHSWEAEGLKYFKDFLKAIGPLVFPTYEIGDQVQNITPTLGAVLCVS